MSTAGRYPASGLPTPIQQNERRRTRALGVPGHVLRPGGKTLLVRLLPAAVAAYELRYLIAHLAAFATALHGAGSLWELGLAGTGAAWLLRESGRGLAVGVRRPAWSLSFVGLWMLCSLVLATVLAAVASFHAAGIAQDQASVGSLATATWSAVPAGLLIGFVLAASLHGARWLLLELVRLRRRASVVRSPGLLLRGISFDQRTAAAPLRAGWPDRGPPTASPAAF